MSYWVYENWRAGPNKVVLHHGSCGLCKDGKGARGGTNPAYGKWHGAFASRNDAQKFIDAHKALVKIEHGCVSYIQDPP